MLELLRTCAGFQWDEHNAVKVWVVHRVSPSECEEAFFNRPLVAADDREHSATEKRLYALGETAPGRKLFIVFTVRQGMIRVISARDMSRKERTAYETHKEDTGI